MPMMAVCKLLTTTVFLLPHLQDMVVSCFSLPHHAYYPYETIDIVVLVSQTLICEKFWGLIPA